MSLKITTNIRHFIIIYALYEYITCILPSTKVPNTKLPEFSWITNQNIQKVFEIQFSGLKNLPVIFLFGAPQFSMIRQSFLGARMERYCCSIEMISWLNLSPDELPSDFEKLGNFPVTSWMLWKNEVTLLVEFYRRYRSSSLIVVFASVYVGLCQPNLLKGDIFRQSWSWPNFKTNL